MKNYNEDERIGKITGLIIEFTKMNFKNRVEISEKGDEIDAIIAGLNMLGEELDASGERIGEYQKRVNHILDILLKYTLLDFSERAEVSEAKDEIDAIALGLNTLSEEFQASAKAEKEHLRNLEQSE